MQRNAFKINYETLDDAATRSRNGKNLKNLTTLNFANRKNASEMQADMNSKSAMQQTAQMLSPKIKTKTLDTMGIASNSKGFISFPDATHSVLL